MRYQSECIIFVRSARNGMAQDAVDSCLHNPPCRTAADLECLIVLTVGKITWCLFIGLETDELHTKLPSGWVAWCWGRCLVPCSGIFRNPLNKTLNRMGKPSETHWFWLRFCPIKPWESSYSSLGKVSACKARGLRKRPNTLLGYSHIFFRNMQWGW